MSEVEWGNVQWASVMAAEPLPFEDRGEGPTDAGRWPGVEYAYDFVRPSYEIAERRHEAIATRARSFLTISAAVIVAAPALARAFSDQLSLGSPWLFCALFLFVVSAALGMWVQGSGWLLAIDLNKLYDNSLHLDAWHFKRDAVEAAGNAFAENSRRINFEAMIVDAVGVFVLGQVLALALWMLQIPTS